MIFRILALAFLALAVAVAPAQAAKAGKGKKGDRMFARFDRDQNGAINGAEVARVQEAYARLAALDTDKDAVLSESELAAAEVPAAKRGKRAKKKSE